jgi:hypothetical protein
MGQSFSWLTNQEDASTCPTGMLTTSTDDSSKSVSTNGVKGAEVPKDATTHTHKPKNLENVNTTSSTYTWRTREIQNPEHFGINDQLLAKEIKDLAQFPDEFWKVIENSPFITICGSFPIAVAHGLLNDPRWSTADIDIFVSLNYYNFKAKQKPTTTTTITTTTTATTDKESAAANKDKDKESDKMFPDLNRKKESILKYLWKKLGLSNEKDIVIETKVSSYQDVNQFITTAKRVHPVTNRVINITIVDDNLKHYQSIQQYVCGEFDVSLCCCTTDGVTCTIPCSRDRFLKLYSTFNMNLSNKQKSKLYERLDKYQKRGVTFAS